MKKACSFLSAEVVNLASQISARELSWGSFKAWVVFAFVIFLQSLMKLTPDLFTAPGRKL